MVKLWNSLTWLGKSVLVLAVIGWAVGMVGMLKHNQAVKVNCYEAAMIFFGIDLLISVYGWWQARRGKIVGLLLAVGIAAMAHGQSYQNNYATHAYSTPEAALTFMGSQQTVQQEWANLLPTETFTNNSLYGAPLTTSWLVTYTPTSSDPACKIPSSGAPPPVFIFGEPLCANGLSGWTVETFGTPTDARNFVLSLDSLRRQASYVLSPPGTWSFFSPAHYWLVVYPAGGHAYCY
jgi:hypothetical protein